MLINAKSVEILLRTAIEHDVKGYEKEMDFLIKDATSKNKKQQSLDLQDIHNKVLYYFANTSKNPLAKNITQKASSSIKIEENDLYKVFYPEEIKETSLIYPSELQQKLEGIVKNRENRETILKNNLPYPNKILLYGEPGTGKTQIAINLAKKLNIPLILVRLDEVISSYLGKTGKNIKDIFSLVEKYECILFFDELDAIGKNRNDHQELGELKRVVTVFLQNLDIATIKGLIIGATNHPNIIDLALRRRFDTLLSIHVPTKKERETIFFASLLPQAKTVLEQQKIPLQEILPELTGSYIKKIADHINRTCIIEDTYDSIIIIKAFFESINSKIGGKATSSTKTIAKALYNNKFETKDIASIMSKPYTTVRDRVLATN